MQRTKKIFLTAFMAIALALSSFCGLGAINLHAESVTQASLTDIDRPDFIEEGLDFKSLDEIEGRRVTIRQPIMQVIERGLERKEPSVLSNTFTLPGGNAQVTFNQSDYPAGGKHVKLSLFRRYMLIRQARYLNSRAQQDAEAGTLAKHPGIDGVYGQIPVEANAVTKKIITDPDYQTSMTTGLYLAPGEVAEVTVKGLQKGQTLQLFTHHQEVMTYIPDGYSEQSYYQTFDAMIEEAYSNGTDLDTLQITGIGRHDDYFDNLPCMQAIFNVTENDKVFKIGSPYGGPLYIQPLPNSVEITIKGAVETPHFILGVTTLEEFEALRSAPGLIGTIDVENGQLIGPAKDLRVTDDIEKVAYFWHSALTIMASFSGKAYNNITTLSFDYHVPAGAAVAFGVHRVCQPDEWFPVCTNYSRITTEGNWGTFHELGHVQDDPYGSSTYGMHEGKEGEVTNNVLICLVYAMLCNMDTRVIGVEHGDVSTNPYSKLKYSLTTVRGRNAQDYSDLDFFDMVSQYSTLISYFGPQKFVDFLYTYSQEKQFTADAWKDQTKGWRADYAYRMAITNKMNIVPWLNQEYKTGIVDSMFTPEQLQYIHSLPEFWPIACTYANGTNDVEVSRKLDVDFSSPTEFDFSGENILCPVEFEILGYTAPKYGKIAVQDIQHVTYYPSSDLIEGDEFSVRVRIKRTGITVSLPIRMNYCYTSSYTEYWANLDSTNFDKAVEYSKSHEPSGQIVSVYPGRNTFNEPGIRSFSNTKFMFVADQDGEYNFYIRSDDASKVSITKDGEEVGTMGVNGYDGSYKEIDGRFVKLDLVKGEKLLFDCNLVNNGGQGFLTVGVKEPGQSRIANIQSKNMLFYNLTDEQQEKISNFGWQPRFLVSVKNTEKKAYASREGWQVLETPIPEKGSTADRLLDGNIDTEFHSSWTQPGTPFPHTYVLDTQKVQDFNFFEMTTRNNVNSYMLDVELWQSQDGENYGILVHEENLQYYNRKATLAFDNVQTRFFKLIVNKVRREQDNFSVFTEINAGLMGRIQQTVKPSTFASEIKGFKENSANGELVSTEPGSTYSFDFVGTGFQIYATTSPSYGSATIYIDGKESGNISLNEEFALNRYVYGINSLSASKHNIKIVTKSDAEFHIGFINVDYAVAVEDRPVVAQHALSKDEIILIASLSLIGTAVLIGIAFTILKKRKI